MRKTSTELYRLIIPIILLVGSLFLIFNFFATDFIMLVNKLLYLSIGIIIAHLGWTFLFGGYIDMKTLLESAETKEIDANAFLGVCILRGLFYLAVILGLALAL